MAEALGNSHSFCEDVVRPLGHQYLIKRSGTNGAQAPQRRVGGSGGTGPGQCDLMWFSFRYFLHSAIALF
jgi:hypothetical protein